MSDIKQSSISERLFTETLMHVGNKKAVLSQRWPRDARYI